MSMQKWQYLVVFPALIVCARLDRLPDDFVRRLGAAGVRVGLIDPRTVRFVTHKDVDDDDIARAIAALDGLRAA